MQANKKGFSCLVCVGNGQGMVGWALIKKDMARQALRAARDAAVKRLCFFETFEERTIYQVLHFFW